MGAVLTAEEIRKLAKRYDKPTQGQAEKPAEGKAKR